MQDFVFASAVHVKLALFLFVDEVLDFALQVLDFALQLADAHLEGGTALLRGVD
jgi:hypothetical protein